MITIEDLAPKEHLLRKVEAMLDLSFIYEETAHLYNRKYARPAIDPVILVKYPLLGYLYGIPSERQIEERRKDSAGDASDKAPYLAQMERVTRLLPIQKATADSAYDFGLAHQVLGEHGVSFFVRPMESDSHPSVEFHRKHFQYDQDNDCFLCPKGKELALTTVSRNAGSSLCWVYSADRADCQSCPMKEQCLSKSLKDEARRLTHGVFEDAARKNLSQANSPEYQQALRLRQIWCEGTFAIQKWIHNLTRVLRRGLEAAEDHCLLSATALNLKRMIKCMG